MNDQSHSVVRIHAQLPGHEADPDVDHYYVLGTEDGAKIDLYWVLDSSRNDELVAGPLDKETAIKLAEILNADAAFIKARAQVEVITGGVDEPESGRVYQLTGTSDDRCLLTTGRWGDSVADE